MEKDEAGVVRMKLLDEVVRWLELTSSLLAK